MQREKLAALGQMSAGLAHELNNPAAAARRNAAVPGRRARRARRDDRPLRRVRRVARGRRAARRACSGRRMARNGSAAGRDALAVADAEDAMGELLEAHGVTGAWELAEPLAAAGLDAEWLDAVAAPRRPGAPRRGPLGGGVARRALARRRPARRHRPHLAPRRRDQGLHLHGPGRPAGGRRPRRPRGDADDPAPQAQAHADRGRAPTTTRRSRGSASTARSSTRSGRTCSTTRSTRSASRARSPSPRRRWHGDGRRGARSPTTGPASPRTPSGAIFEPFFTTKGVGAGTGLGLDTARRIVLERHDGDLALASRPGETTFTVRLPRAPRKGVTASRAP